MNIVTEKKTAGRLIDGINTVLQLDDKAFNSVIEHLSAPPNHGIFNQIYLFYTTDNCEIPTNSLQLGIEKETADGKFIGRAYYGGQIFSRAEIMAQVEELKINFQNEDSPMTTRLDSLSQTCGVEALQAYCATRVSPQAAAEAFGALESDKNLEKYLSSAVDKELSLKVFAIVFNGKLLDNFYAPEKFEWQKRFKAVHEKENMDRYKPVYKTTGGSKTQMLGEKIVVVDTSEEEWEINPKLREHIVSNMPQNLSAEQKAIYIYCQLVKTFTFNLGYRYRDHQDVQEDFSGLFDKKRMEGITPKSDILCFDICRIFKKLASEIEGITPVIVNNKKLADKDEGHYRTGFYSNEVSVGLEPTSARGEINDLYKAKSGVALEGIDIVSDRKGLIKKALETVYPLVFGNKMKTTEEHMAELKSAIKPDLPMDIDQRMQAFIEAMQQHKIQGTEAVLALLMTKQAGFWNKSLELSFVGGQFEKDGQQTRQRKVVLNDTQQDQLHLFDPAKMTLEHVSVDEMRARLQAATLVYEREQQKITLKNGEKVQ